MAVLTRAFSETDGNVAEASSVNRVIDDLYSTINALNSANIVSQAVTLSKLDLEAFLSREAFVI